MQRKSIFATFPLPRPIDTREAWQPGTPPPGKGILWKGGAPSLCCLIKSLPTARDSLCPYDLAAVFSSSLHPICCSATKRSKNNVYFSKLENGTNHPKGENDNGMSSARARELTLPARDRKLEPHGKRLNGTRSNESARNRGHRWPNPAERITHPPVSPSLERAQGLCHGGTAINASALQVCAYHSWSVHLKRGESQRSEVLPNDSFKVGDQQSLNIWFQFETYFLLVDVDVVPQTHLQFLLKMVFFSNDRAVMYELLNRGHTTAAEWTKSWTRQRRNKLNHSPWIDRARFATTLHLV